jgi:outer membrane immunogenic protein
MFISLRDPRGARWHRLRGAGRGAENAAPAIPGILDPPPLSQGSAHEADIQGSDIKDSFKVTVPGNGGPLGVNASQRVDFFGTVRGRVGIAFDRTLIYGTGGFAYGGVRDNILILLANGGATAPLNNSTTATGFAAGGDIEHYFMPSWSVKGEYQYIDLGSQRLVGVSTNGVLLNTTNIDTKFHTVRLGINYKLGGPIVAKY